MKAETFFEQLGREVFGDDCKLKSVKKTIQTKLEPCLNANNDKETEK